LGLSEKTNKAVRLVIVQNLGRCAQIFVRLLQNAITNSG